MMLEMVAIALGLLCAVLWLRFELLYFEYRERERGKK